jgi:hypothetical protein
VTASEALAYFAACLMAGSFSGLFARYLKVRG